ncbi:MAG: cellulase family glycosylhydrolase [Chloroflexi bacterium]|nr:cellulase family glycosylhydrolase [Chloroflexota bacterium]
MRPTWRHLVALAVLALVALDVALGSALSADDREAAEQFARDALRPVADVLARPAVLQECRADPAHLPPSPPRPDGRPSSYYHTCRGRLADADGAVVQIVGVNWFGMETESYVPHGLWARNWRAVLDQVALLGFNTIRLPFSNEALVEGRMPSGIDYELNPDLEGKTSLEVLDMLVDGAAERGLKVILDRHRPTPEGQSELWYTPAVSEERWIADWVKLAQRYRGHDTVIGVDLHNEPRGAATWGSGDLATDWRLAAERAGNAILEANPYLLVFVQGVERYGDDWYWWGGNLRGVRDAPIRLQVPGRLVYSPHLYGPSVYPQSWFQAADFPRNLPLVWNAHWGYVAREGLAPVVLGEFGARSAGDDADGKWQQTLMDYLHRYGIGWINWSLNPNSDDTGGLLGDDWQTVLGQKAQLYRAYAAAPPASGSAEGSEASGGRLVAKVRSSIVDEQSSTLGFVVQVVNDGPEPVKLRDLELRYWFTPELLGASTQQVEVDYAAVGTRNVQAEIEPAGPLILNWSKDLRPAQDERGLAYVKLTFTDAAGALQPYTAGGDILVRVHKSDWSPYRQSNDFSFKPDGELGDWDHVTLYRDGERVWGVEPESADGRRQPAADSGQPAAGGRDRWWMRASEPEGEE